MENPEDTNEYTITLKYQDDGATADGSLTTTGGKLADLPTPTRENFTFKGWFDAETGGNQVTTETIFNGTVNTIYAQWEAASAGGDGATYSTSYAYDCSRTPTFPKKGDNVTLRSFKEPLYGYSSFHNTTSGSWQLINKGEYITSYEEQGYDSLESLLNSIARIYSVDTSEIDVYELRDGEKHICYGVLCATFNDGYFFIGTTWYGGAGYFLSNKELARNDTLSDTVTGDCASPSDPGSEPPHEHEFGQWRIVKEATSTEEGLLERVCLCGETETKVIAKLVDAGKDNDNGNVVDTTPDTNACHASLENIEAVAESIPLGPDDYIAIQDGADLSIYLEVVDVTDASETMSEEDKTLIKEIINSVDNMKQGMLIDVSLFKKIGNGEPSRVTETKAPIKITFKMPESLINNSKLIQRSYYIIRVHNGDVDIINGSFDTASGEFTFVTDKFSSYAIAYIDSPIAAPAANTASGHTHVYNQEFDEAGHWKSCSCGSIIKKSEHTFGTWKTVKGSTETEDGIKTRTCTVCGYSETCNIEDAATGEGAVIEDDIIDMTGKDLTIAITLVISAAVIGMTIIERRKVRK